jgi:selenide,water dikinase
MEHPDDAAVVRTPSGDRIIQTVDIIAPIVNDAAMFGRIACANSLSDVYAMGGRPLAAMNIACFPSKKLPLSLLRTAMDGAVGALDEAGCLLVGGHAVDDDEFKFGFSVTGLLDEGEALSIDRARPGHVLVLTKPIGTGVVNQSLRKGNITDTSDVYLAAQASMATLNGPGASAARAARATAMTDVTGFGLLGHGAQFARASGVTFAIDARSVPMFEGVRELVGGGICAGRAKVNAEAYRDRVRGGLDSEEDVAVLFDPQTSGGLLVALEEDRVATFVEALGDWPLGARVIGRVIAAAGHDVVLE